MKPKQFIKTLYEGRWKVQLNQELKEIFEQAFPELVKKEEPFKNGDILKSKYHIIKITDYEHKRAFGFNFSYYVDPKNLIQWSFITDPDNWEKVDISVWKERLIEECKKRGIWDNPYINPVEKYAHLYSESGGCSDNYLVGPDRLWSKYGCIYENGVFATPIETITKSEAEKQLGKKIID